MKVYNLKKFGEDRFVKTLFELMKEKHSYNKRNQEWFEHLITNWDDKEKYLEWFFLMDEGKLAAFATIQPYYHRCYRMLTRLYISREHRRFVQTKKDEWMTPSMRLLNAQSNYIDERYRTMFVSLQDVKRRSAATRYKDKLEWLTCNKWTLCPDMVQTCANPKNKQCWQNVIYTGESPKLDIMSITEWKRLK